MKSNLKWALFSALALAVTLFGAATSNAQTAVATGSYKGVVITKIGPILAATVPTPVSLTTRSGVPTYNKDFVLSGVSSQANIGMVLTFYDEAGAALWTQAVTATTTPSSLVSFTAPVSFAAIKASATTTLTGSNSVSLTSIEVHK
jgi:hypothetical protein